MNYYIKILSNKPKEDINQIVERMGYQNIAPKFSTRSGLGHLMLKVGAMVNILLRMHKGDTLLIQYPMKKFVTPAIICAHIKGAKVKVLIHDLGCFRRKRLSVKHEMRRMNRADSIIAHNEKMRDFMQSNGCTTPISCLGIFDYLSPSTPKTYTSPHSPWRIMYAGGLAYSRNPYLYQLEPYANGWQMELYGKDFDEKQAQGKESLHFNGLLPPDSLLAEAEADFGLVWDGDSLDECSGLWGEYLRVNNPHKTSFYLRAHIPVIIWSQAALAPFVLQNYVGIAIDHISDLSSALQSLTPQQYKLMRDNAARLGSKIGEGRFTQAALSEQ